MTDESRLEAARAFQAGGRISSFRVAPAGQPSQAFIDILDLLERVTLGPGQQEPKPWAPYTPQEELLDRLNARARGEDPGDPINWKGPS